MTLGMLAGFYRGKIDTVISRTIDIVLSCRSCCWRSDSSRHAGSPNGCLGGIIKPGLLLVSYVIGLFSWPYIARIVRGQVLSLREKGVHRVGPLPGLDQPPDHVPRVLPQRRRPDHRLHDADHPEQHPVRGGPVVPRHRRPAETPSWGRRLNDAGTIFTVAWWMMLFPGLFLFFTTLAFNLVGDGLRDALDPRTGG